MAMKSSKIFLTLLLLMNISHILLAKPNFDEARSGRLLASAMTCDKYPTVCGAKGSAGPYCCNKQCVDVMSDRLNCRKCGKKCEFSEICCKGKCVNPSNDQMNCGKCGNRCKKGSSCVYGSCSYA